MIDFKKIEQKWQKIWEENEAFKVGKSKKPKFYCLEMFPYPSGSGLHMGHAFNYTIGDVKARFKRMHGFNVLYPMGYDSFGLPAENAAIKEKTHPKKFTEESIKNFIKQQKSLGLSYDWDRMLRTSSEEYYSWNQFIFQEFFKKGLIYRKKSPVNWCPKCDTVLANEQVHDGKCWRHDETEVETKELEQWFIKTTEYADELLDNLEALDWPERIKIMQKNWIGRKEWIDIKYEVEGSDTKLTVSTTRPDTNFGATFVVISPEHTFLTEKNIPNWKEVKKYIEKAKKKSDEERIKEGAKKTGVFTGLYCINNLTKKKMPIWVTDFVLMSVGTGVVVGVPGHDIRDFHFAKEFNIPIIRVVVGKDGDKSKITKKEQVQEEEGVMINSSFLDGMNIHDATKKIMNHIEKEGWGKRTIRYRLRDWLVSRQRYWGTPIPFIHCEKCGIVPSKIPVLLPEDVKFGKGNPLETSKSFVNVKCPKCKAEAKRETDTMDTFFDSSWYFLRYCDPKNKKEPFSKESVKYWMPVDQYIGGAEHACMHLIYARFFIKALRDLGFLNFDEPFLKLFNQGMLHGHDGHVMSKSRGNVVLPEEISKKYGIDTARFFLTSLASPDKDLEWSDTGVEGSSKFMRRIIDFFDNVKINSSSSEIESKLNKAIKGVTEDIENFKYNLAIIKIRSIFDSFEEETSKDTLEKFLKLLHPFCPHITEELWEKLGNETLLSLENWPEYDESKIDEEAEIIEETVENIKKDILKVKELANIKHPKSIKLIVSSKWKFTFYNMIKKLFEETRNPKEIIAKIMATDLKKQSKDIMKLIPLVCKDPSRLPMMVLDQEKEVQAYGKATELFAKEFNCEVTVERAEDSEEQKANAGSPLKPAIVLK